MWPLCTAVLLLLTCVVYNGESVRLTTLKAHVPHRTPDGRIIGGNEVIPHSAPFMVGLVINGVAFCGGTLISENYVLTAAHCGIVIRSVEVILGAHNYTEQEPTQLRIYNAEVIVHEGYDRQTYKNDIALLKLPAKLNLNKYIQTIPLPSKSDASRSYTGQTVKAIGWGMIHDKKNAHIEDTSDILMYVDSPVIDNDVCSEYFNEPGLDYVNDGNFCASGYKNKGTCEGDSGGPLVLDGVLVGLTSFGSDVCEACTPSVFTNVGKFLDWIEEHSNVSIAA